MTITGQIATSSAQIASELQTINSQLDKLHTAYKTASGGIDINTLITALVGLLGVFVGAMISYYFTKRINEQASRSRIAIQRKNIIFSKLFKELLAFEQLIEQLPLGSKYVEVRTPVVSTDQTDSNDTFYLDDKSFTTPEYKVWSEMKNDIRRIQVPKKISSELDLLELNVIAYFRAVEAFLDEKKKYEQGNRAKMIEAFQKEPRHENSVFYIDYSGIFKEYPDAEQMIDTNKKRYALSNPIVLDEMRVIIQGVIEMDSRNEVVKCFNTMTSSLNKVVNLLDALIQDIVNKYEYGDSL